MGEMRLLAVLARGCGRPAGAPASATPSGRIRTSLCRAGFSRHAGSSGPRGAFLPASAPSCLERYGPAIVVITGAHDLVASLTPLQGLAAGGSWLGCDESLLKEFARRVHYRRE